MSFKVGQKVKARTMRNTREVEGTVSKCEKKDNGDWLTITPKDKDEKSFKTRAGCVTAL
ncbi:hypothetical protein [Paracidovorax avenae]|uniref:hypothetical protein n=1 Tax=Paracidovorax avenae TaxID=80867 RepID=UPI001863DF45|nr:hypothetical protein [Paracidovorax avenae]